jgi:hypothetical protein
MLAGLYAGRTLCWPDFLSSSFAPTAGLLGQTSPRYIGAVAAGCIGGKRCRPVFAKIAYELANDCLAAIAEEMKLTDEGLVILHQSLLVA